METKTAALDMRLTKAEGFTFDQVQGAVNEAVRELYPDVDPEARFEKGPWIRDLYDDTVVYCWEGQLFQTGYTFANGKATISGSPVAVKVSYVPVGGGAAPPADQANSGPAPAPSADAGAGKGLTGDEFKKKLAAGISTAQKFRGDIEVNGRIAKAANAAAWPDDMSGRGKKQNAVSFKE